jgi:hypothetical protein
LNELQRYLGQGPGVKDGRPHFPPGYFEEVVRLADALCPHKRDAVREAFAFDAGAPGGLADNFQQVVLLDQFGSCLYTLRWLPRAAPSGPSTLHLHRWYMSSFSATSPFSERLVPLPSCPWPLVSIRQRAEAFAPEIQLARWWAITKVLERELR